MTSMPRSSTCWRSDSGARLADEIEKTKSLAPDLARVWARGARHRELRSLRRANDRRVPIGLHRVRPARLSRRRGMQTQFCAPKPTNVRRGTAERRAGAVYRPTAEKEPMSKICKAVAAAGLAATVTLLWAALPAAAEERGTEQERQVCTPDVFRLCTAFMPDPNRITVCLQQNISNLSPACRVVMNGSVQQR